MKFQVGRTYSTRSACDWDCVFNFTVLKRTEKTVTITVHGKPKTRHVRMVDGFEAIDPLGRYSMSPVVLASDPDLSAAA